MVTNRLTAWSGQTIDNKKTLAAFATRVSLTTRRRWGYAAIACECASAFAACVNSFWFFILITPNLLSSLIT